ncbi:MAG: alternative ribosome rescue aminoacyl-tRNA hydrolase ArfB [Acidimicrobiales bacterium]
MPIVVNQRLTVPEAELDWRFSPSGGPGGQHANKANTRVELIWDVAQSVVVTGTQRRRLMQKLGPIVSVTADDERSQARNRDIAERRLAARIRAALVVDKPRRPTKPSRGSKERRLKTKRSRSKDKQLRKRPSADD